jgi:hypothetical protein
MFNWSILGGLAHGLGHAFKHRVERPWAVLLCGIGFLAFPLGILGLCLWADQVAKNNHPIVEAPQGNAREQPAINAVKARGGFVTLDENAPEKPVIGVFFAFPFQEADLALLKPFPNLRELGVHLSPVTDERVEVLARLTALSSLTIFLDGTPTTDDDLERLKPLDKIAALWLRGTLVTDDGLRHLLAPGWGMLPSVVLGI